MVLNTVTSWTEDEENAVNEFRKIMKVDLPEPMYENKFLFYKFLKARNFNLHQAEVMLRKHLKWRKEIQIDTILTDFKTSEVLQKYVSQSFIGFDKEGNLIQYAAIGNTDGKGLFKSANSFDVLRCVLQEMETDLIRLDRQSEKMGRPINQCVFIYDMENMTLAKATHRSSIELFKQGISIFQDNYPEFLKNLYVINASIYFTMVFPIIKAILSGAVIDKIIVYGKDGWKEELLRIIDADVLPAFLGGNRTDTDGNPKCCSIVSHAGMIPESYYLIKDVEQIASKEEVQHITIERHSSITIPVLVQNTDTILNWEYETRYHDIGFGLTMEKISSDNEKVELIPIHRVETENKSETGMFRCKDAGKYFITFDNSYSWFYSKELYYRTWLTNTSEKYFGKGSDIFDIEL